MSGYVLIKWRKRNANTVNTGEILDLVGLAHMAQEYAGALSRGQRKLLELARALMVRPKLILLDEPIAGVNPTLINQSREHVMSWNKTFGLAPKPLRIGGNWIGSPSRLGI